jgi:hypothetical protein
MMIRDRLTGRFSAAGKRLCQTRKSACASRRRSRLGPAETAWNGNRCRLRGYRRKPACTHHPNFQSQEISDETGKFGAVRGCAAAVTGWQAHHDRASRHPLSAVALAAGGGARR